MVTFIKRYDALSPGLAKFIAAIGVRMIASLWNYTAALAAELQRYRLNISAIGLLTHFLDSETSRDFVVLRFMSMFYARFEQKR